MFFCELKSPIHLTSRKRRILHIEDSEDSDESDSGFDEMPRIKVTQPQMKKQRRIPMISRTEDDTQCHFFSSIFFVSKNGLRIAECKEP